MIININDFKQELDQWLKPYWEIATPGLCLEVYSQGKNVFSYQGGAPYPYYDLASLTKVLFTVPAFMMSYKQNLWTFETRVQQIISWWPNSTTKITDLLTHTSGLIWWKPFFKSFENIQSVSDRWDFLKEELVKSELMSIQESKLKNQNSQIEVLQSSVYSDVGFLVLAFVIEKLWSLPLIKIWDLWIQEINNQPLKINLNKNSLHWIFLNSNSHPHRPFPLLDYAPTEFCSWRGRRIQGEVHDENAWILGGVSTHAGLFGSVKDVADIFLFYRFALLNSHYDWHNVIKLFTQRQMTESQGDWALGFMMPTKGKSSSGMFFSPQSIGHTGFTGTSVWWDPVRDFIVIFLSNRLFYGREQREFAKLRPILHDKLKVFSEGF